MRVPEVSRTYGIGREPQVANTPRKGTRNCECKGRKEPQIANASGQGEPQVANAGNPNLRLSEDAGNQRLTPKGNVNLRMQGTPTCECSERLMPPWFTAKGNINLRMPAACRRRKREPQIANTRQAAERCAARGLNGQSETALRSRACAEREPQIANAN